MSVSTESSAQAEAVSQIAFRQVNEEIRRLADNSDFAELEFFCECEHGDCLTRLSVPIHDYEAVRRFPTRFLVGPNHLGPNERIVEETDDYLVVEKVRPGAAAISHDPRKPSTRKETA